MARALTMAGLDASDRIHICYGYGLFTGGLGLDFEHVRLAQWRFLCRQGEYKRQLMYGGLPDNCIRMYPIVCDVFGRSSTGSGRYRQTEN